MKELKFRKLRADEIDARVSQISEKGLSLLLYKDARCDMRVLDEIVGPMNWQREHCRDNANCIVSIWDDEKNQWIRKEDTGTESNTEAEKGLASDSFKRACFNWGIGRELYTAPFVWVAAGNYAAFQDKGKWKTYDKFTVTSIGYDEDGNINQLTIINAKTKKTVFEYGNRKRSETADNPASESAAGGVERLEQSHWNALLSECTAAGVSAAELYERYQITKKSQVTMAVFKDMMNWLAGQKQDYDQTGLPFRTPA